MRHWLFSLILVAVASSVEAAPVTLRWDASPGTDIAGYYVHTGTRPGVYTQRIDAGTATSWTFTTLDESVPHYFAVQARNGAGLVSALSSEVVLPARPSTVPDFGSDGLADILWQHRDGWLSVWHMNGPNLLSSTLLTPGQVADTNWQVAATCDLNADGHPDLVWRHRTMGWISAWFMQGTTLSSDTLFNPGRVEDPRWHIVACADFNRDGQPDLLWQHDTGLVSAWLMNGTTLVNSVLIQPSVAPDTWQIVGTADLNADGHTDILWQHKDGWISTWLMSDVTLSNSILLTPGRVAPEWHIRGAADMNQDGRPDLIWQHNDGYLSVWYMDGATMIDAVRLNPGQVQPGTWQIAGPK